MFTFINGPDESFILHVSVMFSTQVSTPLAAFLTEVIICIISSVGGAFSTMESNTAVSSHEPGGSEVRGSNALIELHR